MINIFEKYIIKNLPDLAEKRILLAVSGGKDSMVLAHLLLQSNIVFGIAHCNFGLRGLASDQDEAFVNLFAEQYKIPFFVKRFTTKQVAKNHKISTQMAARYLRYEWFGELLKIHVFDYLATAHHLNDSFETVLLNLSHGTSLAGLTGIAPQKGLLLRPMLFATRQMIDNYAEEKRILWREDQSNASDAYQRNFIRHQVVPLLQQINPNLLHTFERNAERLQASQALLNRVLTVQKKKAFSVKNNLFFVDIQQVKSFDEPVLLLHFILQSYGFLWEQAKKIVASTGVGKRFFSDKYAVTQDRSYWIIQEKTNLEIAPQHIQRYETTIETPQAQLRLSWHTAHGFNIPINKNIACLAADFLEFPLVLRRWQAGDSFLPMGMKGSKKVSKFLIDAKVSIPQKEQTLVLLSGNKIVWLVGHRISERFRISEVTTQVLMIGYTSE